MTVAHGPSKPDNGTKPEVRPVPRAPRRCNHDGCTQRQVGPYCDDHKRQPRAPDTRPSPSVRGYGATHRNRFRAGVLARDPMCVLCHEAPSHHADHWPLTRRELEAQGLDPDDPVRGRGLCTQCHNRETARAMHRSR